MSSTPKPVPKNIFQLLRSGPLQLLDIPEEFNPQLKKALSDGWIKVTTVDGIDYYSLKLYLMPEPQLDNRDFLYENLTPIAGASVPIPPTDNFFITCTEYSPWTIQARNICTALALVKAKFILDMQKFPAYRDHKSNTTTPCKIITSEGISILELPYTYSSAEYIFKKGNGTTDGANPNSILNAARAGMIFEHEEPTAYSGSSTYPIPKTTTDPPSAHNISGYARITQYNQILKALKENRPIYIVYPIMTSYTTVMSGQTQYLPSSGAPIGYHCSTVVGITPTSDLIIEQTYDAPSKYNFMTQQYYTTLAKAAYIILDANETSILKEQTIKTETKTTTQSTTTPQSLTQKLKKLVKYTL